MREQEKNPQLSFTDAVLKNTDAKDPAKDRVFQKVLSNFDSRATHYQVRTATEALVRGASLPHHELLQQVAMKHPEDVFSNTTQKNAFRALGELYGIPIDLP